MLPEKAESKMVPTTLLVIITYRVAREIQLHSRISHPLKVRVVKLVEPKKALYPMVPTSLKVVIANNAGYFKDTFTSKLLLRCEVESNHVYAIDTSHHGKVTLVK